MALPAIATLTGTFLDGNGAPCSGFVVFSNNTQLRSSVDNQTLSPVRTKVVLEDDGTIEVDLYVTDDTTWDPTDFVWTVREVIVGRPFREYNIQLPSTDLTPRLEDLAPAVEVSPEYESYALASHTHDGSSPGDHDHDSRYFTEAEVTASLAGKADTSHTHDYAATNHNHDASYAALGHNHDASYAATAHTHDSRYYTETETDTLLAGKSSTSHLHDDRYFTESEVTTALSGKSDTSHNHDAAYAGVSHNHDTRYYTETEIDTTLADYYDASEVDALLVNKSDTTHNHDTRYYTETEVDTALSGKASTSHTHAQSDVTNLVTDLAGKAATSHTHAQSDVTGLTSALAAKSDTTHNHDADYSDIAHEHAVTNSAALTLATNKVAWPASTTPTVYEHIPGFAMIVGGAESNAAGSANNLIATLPVGFRPDRDCQFTVRHTVTSASTGTVAIDSSTGAMNYNTALNSGGIIDFTGITFKLP